MIRVLRKRLCRFWCELTGGHDWVGYEQQPLGWIRCRRCRFLP